MEKVFTSRLWRRKRREWGGAGRGEAPWIKYSLQKSCSKPSLYQLCIACEAVNPLKDFVIDVKTLIIQWPTRCHISEVYAHSTKELAGDMPDENHSKFCCLAENISSWHTNLVTGPLYSVVTLLFRIVWPAAISIDSAFSWAIQDHVGRVTLVCFDWYNKTPRLCW